METATTLLGWLLLTVTIAAASPSDPGHLFIPLGKTYPSYSSWAVTLSISVTPYRKEAKSIIDDTTQLSRTAKGLLTSPAPLNNANNSNPNQASLAVSLKHLSHSVEQLRTECKHLVTTFRDLLSLP